jgi:TetR/AcrR family transcriptional repressor of nem operon
MQQVVQATGLKPGSIYLAFGSKEALFRESLEVYADKSIKRIRQTLDSAADVGSGLCSLLEYFVQESVKNNYCSCFLIKTQLELAAEKNELSAYATEKLSDIEFTIRSYLEKEYSQSLSQQYATSIMLHIFGIRVYGYQQGSVERIHQGLRSGLPWLPW